MIKSRFYLLKAFISLTMMAFVLPLAAQNIDTLQNLPNLLFPKFAKGVVKLKNGKTYSAILNYELVEQEMVFLQRKLTIVLDEPQLVDTVYLNNKRFVPFTKGFFELAVSAPITLFIQHKSYVESAGTPIGYGAMSQTTPPSYVRQLFETRGAISLKVPDAYKVVKDNEYWIRRAGEMSNFSSKREFLKIFPDNKNDLEKFISRNRIDFTEPKDVTKLVLYCNEILLK
jgi:hypothetical protein